MKKSNILNVVVLMAIFLVTSCSDSDHDDHPEHVHEEEVITTITATLITDGGNTPIILQSRDLDGDGPTPPVVTVSGDLATKTTYTGTIVLLNETESPAEDITKEVEEEGEEHQFFYTVANSLNTTVTHTNVDKNNNPLGTQFTLKTGEASTGTLTFTLRHEPKKPNTSLADAGGETDAEVTFNIVVK